MSDRYALPDRFVLAYEAEKKSEVAEARKKANREGLRQIQEFADQHDYRQRALIPDAAQTKYVSSFSNHKRSKNQETDARDVSKRSLSHAVWKTRVLIASARCRGVGDAMQAGAAA